jgi:hypothetical protein
MPSDRAPCKVLTMKKQLSFILSLLFQQQVFGFGHEGITGYKSDALKNPICKASAEDNVQAIKNMDLQGSLNSQDARKTALRCCFANYRLHSPNTFEYLLNKNQVGPLSLKTVAAILSINKGSGLETTRREEEILWEAFKAHGWRVYTFIGEYSDSDRYVNDYFLALAKRNLAKPEEFFEPIAGLLNKEFSIEKLLAFTRANFDRLQDLPLEPSMESTCLEYVRSKQNQRLETAYLAKSKKWSKKKHFQFLEDIVTNQDGIYKTLGLRGGFARLARFFKK